MLLLSGKTYVLSYQRHSCDVNHFSSIFCRFVSSHVHHFPLLILYNYTVLLTLSGDIVEPAIGTAPPVQTLLQCQMTVDAYVVQDLVSMRCGLDTVLQVLDCKMKGRGLRV